MSEIETLFKFDDIPYLPNAACKGQHELFDLTRYKTRVPLDEVTGHSSTPYIKGHGFMDPKTARKAAKRVCWSCPALNLCRSWVQSLSPADRPTGVIGGQTFRVNGHEDTRTTRIHP